MAIVDQNILNIISIASIITIGVAFIAQSWQLQNNDDLTTNSYLLAQNKISGKEFANKSFVAEIAMGNIIFLIEFHKEYGYLTVLFPLFVFATKFLVLWILKNSAINKFSYRSLADLLFHVFPSPTVARSIAILTAINCIMVVFAELFIGAILLSVFLPNTPFYKAIAFFSIGACTLTYVFIGGYRAVVNASTLQLCLMTGTALALAYFAIAVPVTTDNTMPQDLNLIAQLFSFKEHGISLWLFIAWAAITNTCIGCTENKIWQRISSTSSISDALNYTFKGFWKFIVIMWTPLLGFVLLDLKGFEFNTLPGFLHILANNSGILGYVIYPVIVMGFAAALFSTIDSNLIAAIYSICDNNTFLPRLNKVPRSQEQQTVQKYLIIACLGICIILSILYYIQNTNLSNIIMPLLYAVWSQAAALAPLALFALYRLSKGHAPIKQHNKQTSIIFVSILILSAIVILYGSWAAAVHDHYGYAQVSFLIAVSMVALSILVIPKK